MKLILFSLFLFTLTGCGVPPYDSASQELSAVHALNFSSFTHRVQDRTISGVSAGERCNPAVLFIHGAPGDWKAWGDYLSDDALLNQAFMLAIDRPGYGGSESRRYEASLSVQANALIQAALKEHPGPFYIVGHSFGGPVAFQAAIDHPSHVSGMMILAGSVDPDLEETKWFQYIADFFLIEPLVPDPLHVANQEIFPLKAELEKQKQRLAEITIPTVVIQGIDDRLVPAANTDYAERHLTNAVVDVIRLENQGHFLPWEQYALNKNEILARTQQQSLASGGACGQTAQR